MNSWTNDYYHDSQGKILGSISLYGDRYKATFDNMFLGWFISEKTAKTAVESAFMDGFKKVESNSNIMNQVAEDFNKVFGFANPQSTSGYERR